MEALSDRSERRVAINTLSRYAAAAATLLTGFFLTPFLIRTVGPARLGLKTLAGQALQFVGLASSALGVSYNRLAASHYARREFGAMNAVLSAGFAVSVLSAAAFVAGSLLAAWKADLLFDLPPDLLPLGRAVMVVTGVATAIHILAGVWKSPVFIRQRFYLSSSAEIFSAVGAAVSVWLAFRFHRPSLLLWVLLDCGYRVAADLFWLVPLCRRALPEMAIRLRGAWQAGALRRMITFGGLNFLGQLGFLLYYATDSILISNLDELGPTWIVYYNVAQRWDPLVHSLIVSFTTVLTPLMTADFAVGRRDRVAATLLRGTRYTLLLAALPCLLLVAFADPFLRHWVGADFAAAGAPVLRVVMGVFFLGVPGILGYEALIACGHLSRAVGALLVGGVLNVALSVLFVKVGHLGLLGVALGSVVPLSLVNGLGIPVWTAREVGLRCRTYLGRGCARAWLAVAPVAALAAFLRRAWEPSSLAEVFLQFALCGALFAVSAWTLGLDDSDRRKVVAAARSVGRALPLRRLWTRPRE